MRSKVKLSFIENEHIRKITFKKRKKGVIKKLDELVKLCDVKACGIFCSPFEPEPDTWPSREGVDEVVSKFKDLPMSNQTRKMMNQETFTRQMISKEKEKLHKLYVENRESQIHDFMLGCLKGELMEYQFDQTDVQDLRIYMRKYLSKLTHRIETLMENGESSSSLAPHVVADAPIGYNDQIHHQEVHQDQQELHGMNMGINLDLSLNINGNSDPNPIPKKKQSFMDLLMGNSQESDDEEDAHIPCMDGLHLLASTASLARTGHMSTAVADACRPNNITNGLKLKGIAFD